MGLLGLNWHPKGDSREIEIRYKDEKYDDGRLLATLTPAEGLSEKAVLQMAEFFACAPEMWRLLRQDTSERFLEFHGLFVEPEIEKRWEMLCKNTGRLPFQPP